jgi:uncharacterized membrane protein HdeD (DUF308 family)
MLTYIAKHWWLLLLRGIAAIIFGLLAWAVPGMTLWAVVLLFGAYAIVDGTMAIANSFSEAGRQHRWSMLLMGLVGIGAGVVAFGWPGITALALLWVIAFWAIFTGILEITAAFGLPAPTGDRSLLGLAGLASTAFGVLLVTQPGAGLLTLVWLLGFYGVLYGVLAVIASFKLRELPGGLVRDLTDVDMRQRTPAHA